MSIIKRPSEIASKETIAALIYGQSGMGKTTLACSATAPVLFDFDGGVARIRDEHQVPTVQIEKWTDALEALHELEGDTEFRTIIVDTASKMIDSIIVHICGTSQPKLQQWGLINATFKSFLRSVQSLGKNVVFVAQREVEKNGEDTRYVPQFRSSNYKDVICDLDVCGYMEMCVNKGQEVRQITFNPTSRNEGKNTADFAAAYIIPTLAENTPNTFLAERFSEYSAKQRQKAERRAETAAKVAAKVEEYKTALADCTDADSINDLCDKIRDEQPVGDLLLRLRALLSAKVAALGITYNKEEKRYE